MMDDRIKKRVLAFYFAGFLNLVLGLYVLLNGRTLVDQGMWYLLLAFFFGFATVDFWFARKLRKQWREAQARLAPGQARDEGGRVSREFEGGACAPPSRRTPDAMQRDGPGSPTKDEREKA